MMGFETFLFNLMAVSTLTSLMTEAIKKGVPELDQKIGSSAVAGLASIVLSIGVSTSYMVVSNIPVSPTAVVYIVAMTFASWLCSMLGYDKVVKVIKQLKK